MCFPEYQNSRRILSFDPFFVSTLPEWMLKCLLVLFRTQNWIVSPNMFRLNLPSFRSSTSVWWVRSNRIHHLSLLIEILLEFSKQYFVFYFCSVKFQVYKVKNLVGWLVQILCRKFYREHTRCPKKTLKIEYFLLNNG